MQLEDVAKKVQEKERREAAGPPLLRAPVVAAAVTEALPSAEENKHKLNDRGHEIVATLQEQRLVHDALVGHASKVTFGWHGDGGWERTLFALQEGMMGQVRELEQIQKEWDTRNAERLAAMKRGKSMAGATAFMASIADKPDQQTGGPTRAAEGGTKTSGLASLSRLTA